MKILIKQILFSLLVLILVSCGSNQTDTADNQLSIGIASSTKSAAFGKPISSAEIAVMSEKLGSYFNGRYASNPEALMGEQTKANDGATIAPKMAASNVATAVYRFFNTNTGAHFFTMSIAERDYVKATYPFFSYEGTSFFAYPDADPTLSPVYRFFNKVTGTHFFTISSAEKDHVIATWPAIYAYEGIAWHASNTAQTGWVPVYRFFNTKIGTHFYTTSAAERDSVIATLSWYSYEGIAYYVRQDAPAPNTGFGLVPNAGGGSYDKTECVKDYTTGLVWEGKPALGWRTEYFTNYTSTTELQKVIGGSAFLPKVTYPSQSDIDASTNSGGFKNAVNSISLCGFNDWRLPTTIELKSLVLIDTNNRWAQIDLYWFPYTKAVEYWTSITSSRGYVAGEYSELVYFYYGTQGYQLRENQNQVRLVRP
jgi:Protein of unknown function (DUF1566)/Repeat of unknown function (DUF5648)